MSESTGTRDHRSLLKKALLEIQGLRARLVEADTREREPLAIIGIGCRFPGGIADPDSFWRKIRDGGDAIGEVPRERWNPDTDFGPELVSPETIHTRRGGFLDQVDQFDPAFFELPVAEAAAMDPQQRLLLEVAWEAFEHAGVPPDRIAGSSTGVFLGITNMCDYLHRLRRPPLRSGTGVSNSIAANRLSHVFDLKGPSLALDTACSSSLVALHLACRSLRQGESSLALVAGVNVILTPDWMVTFSMAGMMSANGLCKSFDASADGYVRSEGCAVVLVKRLSQALADGDRVLALIRGTATNQDGRSSGLTVPHGAAQQDVIRQALSDAGVSPAEIGYVEAHGIGTEMGDPIEFSALKAVLEQGRNPEQSCRVGSVKANIGHAEAASGLSGLIKTVLALQHGQIPPQIHLQTLNPLIETKGTPFGIPTRLESWPAGYRSRLACVNSFGLGGTNAHVILEAYTAPTETTEAAPETDSLLRVLPLSAKSRPALRELARQYAEFLRAPAPPALAEVCFTAGVGRSHFSHRLALVAQAQNAAALQIQLLDFAQSEDGGDTPPAANPPRVALIFGGDRAFDSHDLLPPESTHPRVTEAIHQCEQILGATPLPPDVGLFARQFGLYGLLCELGVVPTVVLGHGVGEHLAAHIAGVLSLDDALGLAGAFAAGATLPAISGAAPRRSWISGRFGQRMPASEPPPPDYWQYLCRESIDPAIGLDALADARIDICIGLGGRETAEHGADDLLWLYPGASGLADTLASLYVRGAPIRWQALDSHPLRRVDLPHYPFQRVRCWLDPSELRHYD